MESNIIYVKNLKYGIQVVKYNSKNLSRICIYKGLDCDIEIYDDLEDFNWNVKRDMSQDFELTDKKTYDALLNEFEDNLKNCK